MSHFLVYWKVDTVLDTLFDIRETGRKGIEGAASRQYRRLLVGDVTWIVNCPRKGVLVLLERISNCREAFTSMVARSPYAERTFNECTNWVAVSVYRDTKIQLLFGCTVKKDLDAQLCESILPL